MAIIKPAAVILFREAVKRPFTGRALTLGRTSIWLNEAELDNLARREGLALKKPARRDLIDCMYVAGGTAVSDHYFFQSLGFDELHSLDASDFEEASIVHDMNVTPVPDEFRERFDVIFNYGTIEHVFHLPNALQNIHDMLKPGGRVIHSAPTSNHPDHGYYMFSPCWFLEYYTRNHYDVVDMKVIRFREKTMFETAEVLDYPRDRSLGWNTGAFDDQVYGVLVTAVKTGEASADLIPQQGMYQELWSAEGPQTPAGGAAGPGSVSLIRRAYRSVKDLPVIGGIARGLAGMIRRPEPPQELQWKRISA